MVMLTNLADVCRDAGLKVREVEGWRTRGRPTGGFNPVGVLCHHTATGPSTSNGNVESLLVRGRSDLPGPLAQLGLERDGTVVVIAAGRANHAGTAKASGSVGAGDGNALFVGVEAYNSGVGEPWPQAQYDAYVTLCAALCRDITGNSAATVRAHRETSVTGKIDPAGIDMERFRARVAEQIEGDDMAQQDVDRINNRLDDLEEGTAQILQELRAFRRGKAKHDPEVRRSLRDLLNDKDAS